MRSRQAYEITRAFFAICSQITMPVLEYIHVLEYERGFARIDTNGPFLALSQVRAARQRATLVF
jgi:hypothetical protein